MKAPERKRGFGEIKNHSIRLLGKLVSTKNKSSQFWESESAENTFSFSNGIINLLAPGKHPGYIFLNALRLIFAFLSALNSNVSIFSNRLPENRNEAQPDLTQVSFDTNNNEMGKGEKRKRTNC